MVRFSLPALLIACLLAGTAARAAEPQPFSRLDPNQYDPSVDPDVDLFIGHWSNSMPRVIHGSLVVRDILTPLTSGDPMRPDTKGACLTVLKRVSYATLEPGAATIYSAPAEGQELYYIDKGSGTLSSGGDIYDLRYGVAFVAPPGVEYTMTTTGDEPLGMFRIVEPVPAGFDARGQVEVRYEFDRPQGISVHWSNIDRGILGNRDGTASMSMTSVKIDPMTMAQPHSHNEGVEEIWIAVRGGTKILLGKQIRDLPPGSVYKIPANGITAHANINATGEQVKLIHMMKNIPGKPQPYSQLDPSLPDPEKDPDVDLFINHWSQSMPRVMYGSLVVRDILTPVTGSDPLRPERKGACLTMLKSVSIATLEPGAHTFPGSIEDGQELYYVMEGEGIISGKDNSFKIGKGSGIIVPPGVSYTFTNDGDTYLKMYRVVEPVPAGFSPRKKLVVTDEFDAKDRMYVHWSNIDRVVLGAKDGTAVTTGFTAVKLSPVSMAQPHSHNPGEEEVWFALEGDIILQIGKEIRKLPAGSAYKVPETGITAHANINLTGDFIKLIHIMKDRNR